LDYLNKRYFVKDELPEEILGAAVAVPHHLVLLTANRSRYGRPCGSVDAENVRLTGRSAGENV
jgi:hypothetical protein